MLIRNNVHKKTVESRVVYQWTCTNAGCQPDQSYIGYTCTTLKQRTTMHAQNGSILLHNTSVHDKRIKAADILAQTKVLHRSQDRHELLVAEALFIKDNKPTINNQREGEIRILHIF